MKSFTLIELLIVVAIVSILAAIAVPNFLNAVVRAKIARVQGDLLAIELAEQAYRLDYGRYTPCADETGKIFGDRARRLAGLVPHYLVVLPVDPFANFSKPLAFEGEQTVVMVQRPSYSYQDGWTYRATGWPSDPAIAWAFGSHMDMEMYDGWVASRGPSGQVPDLEMLRQNHAYGYDSTNGINSLGFIQRWF